MHMAIYFAAGPLSVGNLQNAIARIQQQIAAHKARSATNPNHPFQRGG